MWSCMVPEPQLSFHFTPIYLYTFWTTATGVINRPSNRKMVTKNKMLGFEKRTNWWKIGNNILLYYYNTLSNSTVRRSAKNMLDYLPFLETQGDIGCWYFVVSVKKYFSSIKDTLNMVKEFICIFTRKFIQTLYNRCSQ